VRTARPFLGFLLGGLCFAAAACSGGTSGAVTSQGGCSPPYVFPEGAKSLPLETPKNPVVTAIPRPTVSESQINRFYSTSLYSQFGGCISRSYGIITGKLEWQLYFLVGTKHSVIAAVETRLTDSELFESVQGSPGGSPKSRYSTSPLGSVAATRTPMDCFVSICPREPTCRR